MLKKVSVLLVCNFFLIWGLTAQSEDRPISIGIGAAKTAYNGEVGNSFFALDEEFQASWAARLGFYVSPSFDLVIDFTHGRYGLNVQEENLDFLSDMTQFHVGVNYKLANGKILKENAKIKPFIALGAGVADFKAVDDRAMDERAVQIPLGVGAKYYLTDGLNIWWQSKYGIVFEDQVDFRQNEDGDDRYLQHTLGLAYDFGSGKDTDGDGISDSRDDCPEVAGIEELNGCPDSDGDGIKDAEDECPLVPGEVINAGCPDTDGDGLVDKMDDCPEVAGLMNMKGCPDTDNDGLIDSKDDCPEEAGLLRTNGCPDMDTDGVADKNDLCPKVAGLASLSGCPDSDEDGVADREDDCPSVAGVLSASGCPDADGDGVKDSDDRCPNKKGPKSNDGCPLDPDRDGDGVVDRLDRCPSTPGLRSNDGCPEVKQEVKKVLQGALEGVYFETSSDRIRNRSYAVLDEVVRVMNENPDYKLLISGHTDNVGQDEFNRKLSQKRADAVKSYIAGKGIKRDRMRALGFGETQPVASNNTEAGRAKNRRVEFKIEWD